MRMKQAIVPGVAALLLFIVACVPTAMPTPWPTYTPYPTYTPQPTCTPFPFEEEFEKEFDLRAEEWMAEFTEGLVGVFVEIGPGDTVSKIANKYGANVDDIVSINKLSDPSQIYPDQLIVVPLVPRGGEVTPPPTGPSGPTCCQNVPGALCGDEAWSHVGEYAAVEFCVARTYNSGRAVFLNSCSDYKGHFYVPVFPEYWDCWSEAPETFFYGRCVVVQGEIQIYEGSPEIILRSCDLIRDLGPCNPAADSCK